MVGHAARNGFLSPAEALVKEAARVTMSVKDMPEVLQAMRAELARVTREFADREAGPVGIRLRQIADTFEGGE